MLFTSYSLVAINTLKKSWAQNNYYTESPDYGLTNHTRSTEHEDFVGLQVAFLGVANQKARSVALVVLIKCLE